MGYIVNRLLSCFGWGGLRTPPPQHKATPKRYAPLDGWDLPRAYVASGWWVTRVHHGRLSWTRGASLDHRVLCIFRLRDFHSITPHHGIEPVTRECVVDSS